VDEATREAIWETYMGAVKAALKTEVEMNTANFCSLCFDPSDENIEMYFASGSLKLNKAAFDTTKAAIMTAINTVYGLRT